MSNGEIIERFYELDDQIYHLEIEVRTAEGKVRKGLLTYLNKLRIEKLRVSNILFGR